MFGMVVTGIEREAMTVAVQVIIINDHFETVINGITESIDVMIGADSNYGNPTNSMTSTVMELVILPTTMTVVRSDCCQSPAITSTAKDTPVSSSRS